MKRPRKATPSWTWFGYLAIVLDVFNLTVVGWTTINHLRTELVRATLNMAMGRRRSEGVIHHSDKGVHITRLWQAVPGDGGVGFDWLRWRLLR